MKYFWRAFIVTIIAVAIVAVIWWIASNQLDEGYITAKSYSPAHKTRYMYFIHVGNHNIPNWRSVYHPDRWSFRVEYDGKADNWEVSQEIYNQYEVGDWISR